MKTLRRHLSGVPAIMICVALVALFVFWSAGATPLDRFMRGSSGHELPAFMVQPPSAGEYPPQALEVLPIFQLELAASFQSLMAESAPSLAPQVAVTTITPPSEPPDHARLLNWPRQFALAMIETGNNDQAVGEAGEVSRYQIMPSVWKHYSNSRSYRNPDIALLVARQHWTAQYDYFKTKTGREPTDFDMYVLWNTRYGYYANRGFSPFRVHPVVHDRAQRFSNLVQEGFRREAALNTVDSAG